MPGFPDVGYRLMIVDDDEMVREVLRALATRIGFAVEDVGSGAAALERLNAGGEPPQGVLADMHMPGPSGATFAGLAQRACGSETVILAMSATEIGAEQLFGYHGFLRKPFTMEQMCAALESAGNSAGTRAAGPAQVLKGGTLGELYEAMAPAQLRELYRVFLADAEVRLAMLRAAAASRDGGAWRGAAHQLKGSCGMVGAAELAEMAGRWEAEGLPGVGEEAPFEELEDGLLRLRRVLAAQLP